jgi:calmodulin
MTDLLSENKLIGCKELFDYFDNDKDGELTKGQLKEVLKALGENPDEKELEKMMIQIDGDKFGKLNFKEFVELYSRKIEDPDTEEDLVEGFKLFDKHNKGSFPLVEMKLLLIELVPRLSEEEAEEIVKEADFNNDGEVDFKELTKIILSK